MQTSSPANRRRATGIAGRPAASLDARRRDVVIGMASEARGVAMVGIFHDAAARDAVLHVPPYQEAA